MRHSFRKDRIHISAEHLDARNREVSDILRFEDGRIWKTGYLVRKEQYGREFFGNVCRHYQVYVGEDIKNLWVEHGRWFTRK